MSNDPVIHFVGHGHIDPTWLWRWPEGLAEVRATFRSALARMEEDPDFRFTATSACFYEWVERHEPELFEAIRARVEEGRWEIAGGWWIEPDCNLPSGEALVRQGLYGLRYFERAFGIRVVVGFNPDSFGHAATLPQLYAKMGIRYYCYQRPEPVKEMEYPEGTSFRWQALDGSEVLATNLLESYNGEDDVLLPRLERLVTSPHLTKDQSHVLAFFGVGDHGGGPTKKAMGLIRELMDKGESEVRFSTLLDYFEKLEETTPALPTIKDELQHHARGCYSVHSEIKRLNRRAEHALMAAERWASVLYLHSRTPYPKEGLETAWKDLLYNQFHDILAGTSIQEAYEDARNQLGRALHVAHTIEQESLQRLAADVDTTADGNSILIYNPLPWAVQEVVVSPPIALREVAKPFHLVDDEGELVAHQRVDGPYSGSDATAFTAEVPGLGYRIYHLRNGYKKRKGKSSLDAGADYMENGRWRIEFDVRSGELTRLYDKRNDVEVLYRGNSLVVFSDSSDTWSHGVEGYRVVAGRFGNATVRLTESGPVRATMHVHSTYGKSTVDQWVTIYHETDDIDCRFRVNWQEAHHGLKLEYALNADHGGVSCDVPYGQQERRSRGEEPCQRWVDMTGLFGPTTYGFAVLNDSKYAYDADGDTLRLTVLRSPAYAHHDPDRLDGPWPIIDQGWQKFSVRLLPHAGVREKCDVARQAWGLNERPVVHVESAHEGALGERVSFLECDNPHVVLSVCKMSEDGEDLILRGYETSGLEQRATIHVHPDVTIETEFKAHEIKTLRIDLSSSAVEEVNLLEETDG